MHRLTKYPYPHISIDGIFPEEFYTKILKNLPDSSAHTSKSKYPERETKTLDNLEDLEKPVKEFWEEIIEGMRSR